MNKYSSIKDQLKYLKDINLKTIDELALENFLWDVPFQRSINQLKFYYSKSDIEYKDASCFSRRDSQELIMQYSELLNDSHMMLNNILIFENKIKNALFFDLLEVYKWNQALYSTLILSILQRTKKARQFAFPDSEELDAQTIQELYREKIYKIINASSLKELRDIIEELNEASVELSNLSKIVEENIKTTTKMIDNSKKECANLLGHDSKISSEAKYNIELIIRTDFVYVFSEALINNTYPIDIINHSSTRLIGNISKTKIKKFFKENYSDLSDFKEQINADQLKSKLRKEIERNKVFTKLVIMFVEENCNEIYRLLALSNSETTCDVASYRNRLYETKEVSHHILIKKLAIVSSFRNTISHGNTLLITIKPRKDRLYIETVLYSFLFSSNMKEYIKLLYLHE